ncbi:MAG: YhfX family PLP-dependent enzyme [Negativicutes bacterium]|jgi:predicted amino acid racemase
MFIEALRKNNPRFIEAAFDLYATGELQPDTYLIDLDMLLENARLIKDEADKFAISLYYMTKQFGRNPDIARKLDELGYCGAVAVDWREALTLAENGVRLGHVGHLVQTPFTVLERILMHRPEVLTVYSLDMAEQVNLVAKKLGMTQKLLLKIIETGDVIYPGQEGGLPLTIATTVAEQINALSNVVVEGITAFPCFLFSDEKIKATNNMDTLKTAAYVLRRNGVAINQINTPSATCIAAMPLLKECGSTHGEPGHALTGTTPLHATGAQPERIAMLYISEVSHNYLGRSLCYGGGYYRRSNMCNAIAKKSDGEYEVIGTGKIDDGSIDYYFPLDGRCSVGTPIVFCFRTQVFVTRSEVAVVEGIQSGAPRIIGVYDAQGRWLR